MPCPAHALQQASSEVISTWLSTSFQAADPSFQGYCVAAMNGTGRTKADTGQDATVWRNFFAALTMQGRRGFYVDSGANHAQVLSNTHFFDRCLGWGGLCVEPNAAYHKALQEKRTCTLAPECISWREEQVHMRLNGVLSKVGGNSGDLVQCRPLDAMLARASAPPRVDFWSMDLESYERIVINATDFEKTPVDVLLVEDVHLSNRELDRELMHKGFLKAMQLSSDALYVRRTAPVCWPKTFWLDPKYRWFWQKGVEYRKKLRAGGLLAKDL